MTKSLRRPASDAVDRLLNPKSIAVVGSLREARFGGHVTTSNLLRFGFKGKIYPVNPQYDTVLNLKVYASVKDIPEPVDLVVTMAGASAVPKIIADSVQNKAKVAIIISDGFGERSEDGKKLQQEVNRIAEAGGLRLLGPNTIGVANPAIGLITTPYKVTYEKMFTGGIALCAQTGLIGPQNMPLEETHYGISKMCDFGNKCDVNEVDLLNYLSDDPDTQVVVMHLEDVKDGRSFIDAARTIASHKPLFILKPGRTKAGARASASHTGSLAVSDRIYDSAMKQVGAIRVNTWQEYWDIPKVFAYQPLPMGNRIAIVSHSGGAGVVATDAAVEAGLAMANFSDVTLAKLAGLSPRLARNPIDLGPALSLADAPFSLQEEIIAMVLDDANVDCATIVLYGGVMSPVQLVVEMFDRLKQRISKPVTIWFYGTQLSLLEEMSRQLEERGFPTYTDLETAVKALGALFSYAGFRGGLQG
jgi:acyl-CoA synthetase (NDP forming)